MDAVATAREAITVVRARRIGAAVLDTGVGRQETNAVARILRAVGCPFLLLSDPGARFDRMGPMAAASVLKKPIDPLLVEGVMRGMLISRSRQGPD